LDPPIILILQICNWYSASL